MKFKHRCRKCKKGVMKNTRWSWLSFDHLRRCNRCGHTERVNVRRGKSGLFK